MNAVMSYEMAADRIRRQILYLESRIADCSTSERKRHFASLDCTAFQMGADALTYLKELAEYEATKSK
jgi:hypothetical protein